MTVCLFVELDDASVSEGVGAERALLHTPAQARDPYLNDGPPPRAVLQLYFSDVAKITVPKAARRCEAMDVHAFGVPDARIRSEPWCTYLVAYEGPAKNERVWLEHYLANHPPLMARLPGIRELEIYTPLDWPGNSVRSLQRNKVGFDSAQALTAALDSPVRKEMRADFQSFPQYSGRVTHFPMLTRRIRGTQDPS